MTTDLGAKDSPTHLVVFHPSDGQLISRSQTSLRYSPWGLAFDEAKQRLLGVWVNDAKKWHEVVEIDPLRGNHTVLLVLPQHPYCSTQNKGECKHAIPPWGKVMLDQGLRRWTLPMSSHLGWNLTLLHVNIDHLKVAEVSVPNVGYHALYSTVTNTALHTTVTNTALHTLSEPRFIIALCAKCTGYMGSICTQETSLLVQIDPETGAITEIPGPTGIAWTTGAANSVYDAVNAVLYYVQYTEASFSQRRIVALATNGSGPIGIEWLGSELPPDVLLLV